MRELTGENVIYIMDLCNKIVSNISRFFPAALLVSLVLTLLYRFVLQKEKWISFFFFCIYLVLLFGETLWGRLGMNIKTKDFIGVRQLMENPWYVAAAVYNVVMFIPFGVLAVGTDASEKEWPRCLFWAFAVSCCIELAQYELHLGEAQLVDVLANTMGAFVGILLRKGFTWSGK